MTFYGLDPKAQSSPRGTIWRSRPSFVFSSSSYYKNCRRITAVLVIAVTYFLLNHLSATPNHENESGFNRPAPYHDVGARPYFVYHSPFRDNPDVEYESRLDEVLRRIEQREDGGLGERRNRLWQIMLRKNSRIIDRSHESRLLEEHNPEWEHTIVTNDWATDFITNTLSSVPDLADVYNSYPSDVLRADLLRYLILWYYGGYYADMDVHPKRSINGCPALQPILDHSASDNYNLSLVLGVEIDEPYASPKLLRKWRWSRSYQFIQYNMYAPRRFSPLLRRTIARALAHTKQHKETSSWFFGPRYDEKTTLEVTGPGLFTDAVLDGLSEALRDSHPLVKASVQADSEAGDLKVPVAEAAKPHGSKHLNDLQVYQRVTWAPFHHLEAPLWIDATEAADGKEMGGLGVLPINVWGSGQRHSGAENFLSEQACVNHLFGGSWKKGKKRKR